ncbi:response regulator transcription factor [Priestia megaterium]|uniref:Response regulator transcription factor n=1 Tax=Priestia megaterium TaxID=1404 RepID=A0ABD4WMG5_PRIMG|nr:response regulator transcription factor [Priestia megaterium]MBV6737783.1 response regulator transcription factor [Priestia megaterium]MDD9781175.1 response regulator transcription factor [Priestia megaterium]QLC90812.1 response regulator transcription factor [Priestia megaterium]
MINKIKVILVEDEPFWQQNISEYIEKEADDIEVISIVDSKEETLKAVETASHIDVVLMDINLTAANLDGIEIIEILSRKSIKTIALTSISEEEVIVDSFESGAINYINKSNIYDIIAAIYQAIEGRNQIHADAAGALLSRMREEKKLRRLTDSEKEVYKLEQKGYPKKDIAKRLYKTIDTIKKHSKSWRKKLNA